MNDRRFFPLLAAFAVLLCVPVLTGAKKNLADFNLRIHIYQTNWSRDRNGYHAFGRGNLFDENGLPHGVDFTYDCDDHLMGNPGSEAYPAKWKKPSQSIDVIFGQIGEKPDNFHDCEFKIAQKSFAYYRGSSGLSTESPQDFQTKHPGQGPARGPLSLDDVPRSANPSPN